MIFPDKVDGNISVSATSSLENVKEYSQVKELISNDKFSLFLNSIPSIVTYVDKNHNLQYVNAAFEKVFNVDYHLVVGKPIADFLGEDGYACIKEFIEIALSGKKVHYEMEVPFKAGTRYIDANYTPDFDESGKIKGYIGLINDITEKKKIEKELFRKQRELEDYVVNGNIGLHWVDADGIIIWANDAELNMLGYLPQEYLGHSIIEFHANKEKINDILNRLSLNEILNDYEAELKHKNGSVKTVLINSSVLWEDGKFIHTRCFTTDITERKQIEETLLESESRYKVLIENLPAAIYTCNAQGQILLYNQVAAKLWGRKPKVGKELWCGSFKIYHADGITAMPLDTCPMAISLKEGRAIAGKEIVIERPDGTKINVHSSPVPIFDKYGKITGAVNLLLDITEEKKAAHLIWESEERLRMAVQSTRLGTWEYFPVTGVLSWSEECRKIYDAPGDIEINYQFFVNHVHPEDAHFAQEAIEKAMDADTNGNYDIQYRILRYSDKQPRWIWAQGKVYFNMNKQAVRFIGTILDITEEKIQEQELLSSVELFSTMADNVPAMIWMSGKDKFSDYFNKAWLEYTGRTIEEESHEGWLENVHPGDMQKCIDNYIISFKEQRGHYSEYRLKRHDGQYRWIAENSVPRFHTDGSFVGFISACIDIDDQKNYREKIQESELKLKTISNASPVGLWMTDTNAQNTFVNDTWIKWTGIRFEKQLGMGWLARVIDEDKKNALVKFWRVLKNREKYSTEFRITRADGELRWCLTEGAPYYDLEGEFAGYAGSVTDITDLKKMEERKDDFIKIASHELKTPITSIKGYVQLLSSIYNDTDEKRLYELKPIVKSSLNTISRQVSNVTRLILELLDLSRIESGKLELNKTEFDVGEIIEEAVQDVRHTTSQHTLLIQNNFKGSLYADRDRICQVLLNLLTNAIKYSPDGGNIDIIVKNIYKSVSIEIKDQGIGIEIKDQDLIFNRFYRVEGKNEQTYPGFGIGLFITNEIVERHNGTIIVRSKKGIGSSFTISLPLENNKV